MVYRLLAEIIVTLHLAFVLFAVFGGFLVLRWKGLRWLHLPAVLWAALNEFAGWVCPLTPLENWLREQSGAPRYHTGFIEHYLIPILYPAALTRDLQIILGTLVLGVNLVIYAWVSRRGKQNRP